MSYLLALGMSFSYFVVLFFFQFFALGAIDFKKITYRSLRAVLGIFLCNLGVVLLVHLLPDQEWGNRILHTFGGGMLMFFVCLLAYVHSGVQLSRFQFCTLTILIVTSFGVLNELIEFLLQTYTTLTFATTTTDAWLDLTSNTVGCILAMPFIFFLKKRNESTHKF